MKRNILYIAMACALAFVSCKKEKEQQSQEGREVEFGATVDESNGSKTYLDGTSVLWADGDQISVNGTAIDLVAGAGYKYGTFRGKVTPYSTNSYYVGYPASATTFNTSTGEMTVSLPTEQNYSTDKPLSGVMPMAAYVEGTGNKMTIHFQNVANVLALKLFGTAGDASKVTSIEITSSDAALTGVVATAINGTITPCAPSGDGKTITLNCGTGVQLGTDAEHTTPIYVAIPKITTATTLNVRTYCANGAYQQNVINVGTSTFSGSNMIYSTQPKEVNAAIIDGALPGEFTVNSDGKKVKFSQGNLQYLGSGMDGNSSPIWRFADNQYDYMAGGPSNSSSSKRGNVNIPGYTADGTGAKGYNNDGTNRGAARDLFGWGTSGIDDYTPKADCYQPWETNTSDSKYNPYGSSTDNLYDNSGKADWGYNAIYNGGNTINNGWRTLRGNNEGEWWYLLAGRNDAAAKVGYATVAGVHGLIILPDIFTDPKTSTASGATGGAFSPKSTSGWNANVYTTGGNWEAMESAGAVFLPAEGYRSGTSLSNLGIMAYYWSSSANNSSMANYMSFSSTGINEIINNHRAYGFNVRLVRDASNGGSSTDSFIGVNW